ncbi:glutamyl-tRNA reductase [Candidatus Bathyarchaeota archaeon]|nr:MAG: glutamyl-tRNA reductase [Candidatus Bathyarchaeota archaeon]
MPNKSLKNTKNVRICGETSRILNLRFTHKKTPITTLEALTFNDLHRALEEMHALSYVQECVILQTCNRVEIFATVPEQNLVKAESEIAEHWRQRAGLDKERFYHTLEKSSNSEALIHLLRLTSGLESMIVGEDQILGQVREAVNKAKKCGTIGPILETAFKKAVKTGIAVRLKTAINKGAISIGSAAVDLLEEVFGDLKDRKIVVVGAGETGGLVGKALALRKQAVLFVANRTYDRGVRLARMLGGQAVRFNKLSELLAHVDAVIVATSAPHYVLKKELVERILDDRKDKKLLIIDLAQPRNVEESVAELPNIELRNIDDLRGVAETNLRMRLREAKRAETIVEKEARRLELMLKRKQVEPIISAMCCRAEEIRCKELKKALRMLGKLDDEQRKVIDNLTHKLTERILYHPIVKLRKAAESGDVNKVSFVQELFGLNPPQGAEESDVS